MAKLRTNSQRTFRQLKQLSSLQRFAMAKKGIDLSRLDRIREICFRAGSTLVLLERGFGEYYQCGYWAALENRGSRLLAAARGSNPLLSAGLRDPRAIRTRLSCEWILTRPSSNATLKMVLKRGPAPFLGGLTGRLSILSDLHLRSLIHA